MVSALCHVRNASTQLVLKRAMTIQLQWDKNEVDDTLKINILIILNNFTAGVSTLSRP